RPFDEETAAAPLRERSSDVEDVTRRLLVALSGESMRGRHLTEDAVIVAEELMPSTIAELDFTHINAIATDVGGWTSHPASIARGLVSPAVGALRIGRCGSEFLLTHRGARPSEEEQRAAYEELARVGAEDGVAVRLFDLGGDKATATRLDGGEERNPALGLRAIRFCLRREDVLRTQARAVLRAAARGRVDLVLPVISDVSEVRRTRRVIDAEQARLRNEGQEIGTVRVGAMIEVPSAVLVAERLARAVDFFRLGTIDLVPYPIA